MQVGELSSREIPHPSKAPPDQDPRLTYPLITSGSRLYRIWQILGKRTANPPIEPIIPISRAHFYSLIAAGILPGPKKYGRNSFWPEEDVQVMREVFGGGQVER